MKFLKHLKALRPLDSRGSLHVVLPLVAVAVVAVLGTYSLVAGHANASTGGTSPPDCTPGAKCAVEVTVRPQAGFVGGKKVIVGYVGIRAMDASGKTVDLPANKCVGPRKVSTAVGEPAVTPWIADLRYVKPTDHANGPASGYGYCLAHLSVTNPEVGKQLKITSAFAGNRYLKAGSGTTNFTLPDKLNPTLTPVFGISQDHKAIVGSVTIKLADKSLTKGECNGQVSVIFTKQPGPTAASSETKNYRINKYFVPANSSLHYCKASGIRYPITVGETYNVAVKIDPRGAPYLAADPVVFTAYGRTVPLGVNPRTSGSLNH